MFRHRLFAVVSALSVFGLLAVCEQPAGLSNVDLNTDLTNVPAGTELIFREGFEDDLMQWDDSLFVLTSMPPPTYFQYYQRMRITDEAAHSGMYSLTSDSSKTALESSHNTMYRIATDSGETIRYNGADYLIKNERRVGIQYFIMAKEMGEANFILVIGQHSDFFLGRGGMDLLDFFGIGFAPNDSIQCLYVDNFKESQDTMIAPIKLNTWYKCNIEIDFPDTRTDSSGSVTYYLDDVNVCKKPLPEDKLFYIDRILLLRGEKTMTGTQSADGSKKYYVDDIALYHVTRH